MIAMLAALPNTVKLIGSALIGALLTFGPVYLYGKHAGRADAELTATKNALDRIEEMNQHDAKFRNSSPHDRCITFMRDSGLPSSECD